MKDSGVMPMTAMVFGQMNETPGPRARVAMTGLTLAEYFRDKEQKDVLLFVDNIFRLLKNKITRSLFGMMESSHRQLKMGNGYTCKTSIFAKRASSIGLTLFWKETGVCMCLNRERKRLEKLTFTKISEYFYPMTAALER